MVWSSVHCSADGADLDGADLDGANLDVANHHPCTDTCLSDASRATWSPTTGQTAHHIAPCDHAYAPRARARQH